MEKTVRVHYSFGHGDKRRSVVVPWWERKFRVRALYACGALYVVIRGKLCKDKWNESIGR